MTKGKCLLLHIPKLNILEDGASSSINFIAMGIYSLCHQLVINGFDAEVLHLSVEKYLDKSFSAAKYVKDNNIKFIAYCWMLCSIYKCSRTYGESIQTK
mgnify:CR=1 FL=1